MGEYGLNTQEYRTTDVDKKDILTLERRDNVITAYKTVDSVNGVYISEKVSIKPKALHNTNIAISGAKKVMGIDGAANTPKYIIVDSTEKNIGTAAYYNPIHNVIVIDSNFGDFSRIDDLQKEGVMPENIHSTVVHELIHWQDAEQYKSKYGAITNDNVGKYKMWLNDYAKKEIDKLEAQGYNVRGVSEYASRMYDKEKYNETYTEYRTYMILGGGLK